MGDRNEERNTIQEILGELEDRIEAYLNEWQRELGIRKEPEEDTGWDELLRSHGLDIMARDLEQELRKELPDIDRRMAGFKDFASEGRRSVEPLGTPLGTFPTLAEIETVESKKGN
jgi:hypothetical protein